jgi:hypothetical protein
MAKLRINALEQEVERYKAQVEALPAQATGEMSSAELLQKVETLEKVRTPRKRLVNASKTKSSALNFRRWKQPSTKPTSKINERLWN